MQKEAMREIEAAKPSVFWSWSMWTLHGSLTMIPTWPLRNVQDFLGISITIWRAWSGSCRIERNMSGGQRLSTKKIRHEILRVQDLATQARFCKLFARSPPPMAMVHVGSHVYVDRSGSYTWCRYCPVATAVRRLLPTGALVQGK